MMYKGKVVKEGKDLTRKEKYRYYIAEHAFNVRKAFKENESIFRKFFSEEEIEVVKDSIEQHDDSKFIDLEFDAYLNKFYPENENDSITEEEKRAYDLAWMHHYTHNLHHPESWVIIDHTPKSDGPTIRILEMDNPYLIEMICDWESFKYDGKGDAYEFYHNIDSKKGLLHENTRKKLEIVLEAIHNK